MNELLIYSDIGEGMFDEGITAQTVKRHLDENPGDISVRINSPGGDVFDGFAIYNLLKQHDGKVTVKVDGLAASAASVVAMAGDSILMAENALMMIHDPWTMAVGSAEDMRETAELLDKVKGSIVNTYILQTGLDDSILSEMMAIETWMDAGESLEMGFTTETISGGSVAASINKPWIKNEPPKEKTEDSYMWRIALNRRRLNLA